MSLTDQFGSEKQMTIRQIYQDLVRMLKNRDGVTAMEYGMIAAATVVAISAFMPGMSTRLSGIFSRVSSSL
jgi:Flp pilus assembly pilin Flp